MRQVIYRWPIPSINAGQESPSIASNLDRCRAAYVVGSARSAFTAIQIPATASGGRFHRRLCLYRVPAGNRSGWWSAFRKRSGHNPNGLAPKPGLESTPVLEQRRPKQYQRGHRDYSAHSHIRVDPHPPSPAGWAPPSPAVRRSAGEGLASGALKHGHLEILGCLVHRRPCAAAAHPRTDRQRVCRGGRGSADCAAPSRCCRSRLQPRGSAPGPISDYSSPPRR